MAGRKLQRIKELDAGIVNKCATRQIVTAKELLELQPLDLSELLDISLAEAKLLLLRTAAAVCPEPFTAAALQARSRQEPAHLSLDLRLLDTALRGGAPAGAITELVGAAGVGKTQLCLQLALKAQLPLAAGGLGGRCVYIDTESRFSPLRLVEIARSRWPEHTGSDAAVEALVRGVVLLTPSSSADLLSRLEGLEATIIELNVRLVIIDSIAALARSEGGGRLADRQALLGEQASRLKALAEAFRIPVIVTNQVTTARGDVLSFAEARSGGPAGAGAEAQLVASLGTKWAHDINLRLALETSEVTGQRYITITKSAAAPSHSFPFEVSTGGLFLTGAAAAAAAAHLVLPAHACPGGAQEGTGVAAQGGIAGGASNVGGMPGRGAYPAGFPYG